MRVYFVQSKLADDNSPCVPDQFELYMDAKKNAEQRANCAGIYTGVRIVSMTLPWYDLDMPVTLSVERVFD